MNAKMFAAIILFAITIAGCVVCLSIMSRNNELDSDPVPIPASEGVILEVKANSVSNTKLTLIIKNITPDEYIFGESYTIEKQVDGEWCQLPYVTENILWFAIGYILEGDSTREIEIDWTWSYGELSSGYYRITKDFSYIRSPGDYDNYNISTEFTIVWPGFDQSQVYVATERELNAAISNMDSNTSAIIVLSRDITLTEPISIYGHKDITLRSDGDEFFKLLGPADMCTILVCLGVVRLEGIIVTHAKGVLGNGVYVWDSGTLFLSGGEISGNMNYGNGGGVYNAGIFSISGGIIANNIAMSRSYQGYFGGGVYNQGSFSISGGVISDNEAMFGGGVGGSGMFRMSGGIISNNKAEYGGGVRLDGTFNMLKGKITNNSGKSGGGVDNCGNFSMSGGEITNNTAYSGCGGGIENNANFTMRGGIIHKNTASVLGGGVFNSHAGVGFDVSGGEITNNSAVNGDDDVGTGTIMLANWGNSGSNKNISMLKSGRKWSDIAVV